MTKQQAKNLMLSAELHESRECLKAAIEAAGLDPATASVDDLIAWIRERRAEWQEFVDGNKRQ